MSDDKKMSQEELEKLFGKGTILFNQAPSDKNQTNESKFIEDHESIFKKLFVDDASDDIDFSNYYNFGKIYVLNPSDAREVEVYTSQTDNMTTTWVSEKHFCVCRVPFKKNTYLLFCIDWDDNFGCWTRYSCCAVEGESSYESAEKELLNNYYEKNIKNSGDGRSKWSRFLKSLKK